MSKDDNDEGAFGGPVGYKNPPKKGQFKKGQSGNPKGRTVDAEKQEKEEICDILDDLFFTPRKAKISGEIVDITYMKMMLMKMMELAIQGDVRAARMMIALSEKYGFAEQKIEVIMPYIPSRGELAEQWKHELEEEESDD